MGVIANPDADNEDPNRVTYPGCGWTGRFTVCAAAGCDTRFVPQPGYSTSRCPLHDPELQRPEVPSGFPAYKMQKARECPRCGDVVLA